MSLEITTVSATIASFTLSASLSSSSVYWYSLSESSNGFGVNSTNPSAIYLDCPLTSFVWGDTANCIENRIKVFNNSRTIVLASTASLSAGTTFPILTGNDYIIYDPPVLIINTTSIDRTNTELELSLSEGSFNAGDNISWNISPWELTDPSQQLSSTGFVTAGSIPGITGIKTGLESSVGMNPITASIPISYYDETMHGLVLTLTAEGFTFTQTKMFSYNSPLQIREDINDTMTLTATVVKGNIPLPTNNDILWFSQPSGNIIHYINESQYTPYTVDTAGNIGSVILSASDEIELSNVYTVYVSSMDFATGNMIFRPYLSGFVDLEYDVKNIYNENNVTVYNVKLLGNTSGITHNLDPANPLYYNIPTSNIRIKTIDDESIFDSSTVANPVDFDNVLIKISNPTATTEAQLISTTYTIIASTLSGNDLLIDPVKSVNVPLTGWAYPSETLFNVVLKISNNSPTNIMFETLPFSSTTYTLSVDGDLSKLLPSTIDGSYSFYKNNVSLTGGTFIDKDDLMSKSTTDITGNITVPTTAIYMLSVSANYNDIVPVTKSYTTIVKYVSVDCITTADIVAYPQYLWQPLSGWKLRVNPDYSLNTVSGGILYGQGRSEDILLSATNIPGVIKYEWYVTSGSTVIYSGETNTNKHWINVKSNCTGTTPINVKLTVYNENNLDMPAIPARCNTATKRNAIIFNPINITTPSSILDAPSSVSAPGTISTSISSGITALQNPINIELNTVMMNISSSYWQKIIEDTSSNLTISDIGDIVLSIPKFELTPLKLVITPVYKLKYYPSHPLYNDWCDITSPTVTGSILYANVSAFPVHPYYYTSNKHVLTGITMYDNVVPPTTLINGFTWSTLSSVSTVDFSPHNVEYIQSGIYGLLMRTHYSDNQLTLTNNDAIHVYNSYPEFDSRIVRGVSDDVAILPYKCGIGSNEWLTSDTINHSFKKIYDNLEHLIYQSKIYDNPPTQYIGWLGDHKMADNTNRFRWHTEIPGLNYEYNNPSIAISDTFNNLQDCVVRDNIMYVSNGTSVQILSSNLSATLIGSKNVKSIGVPFNNIKTIQLDPIDSDRIYLLDNISMEVIIYRYNYNANTWSMLYNWGGLGSAVSHNKYNNPQDMFVDDNAQLWIADTDNLVIKKYTRTGTWILNISSSKFTVYNKPLSICKDSNNNIHVLCTNNIMVFDDNGIYLYEYSVGSGYNRIRPTYDNGFIYISSPTGIIKCNLNGDIQLPLSNMALSIAYLQTLNNRSIFHDEYRNLYVCQNNHILKYVDLIKHISLIKEPALDGMWSLDDININKEEFVQDWVVNKSLNRLWDNIELVRKSIIGKLSYERIVNTEWVTNNTPVIDPVSGNICLTDWWPSFSIDVQTPVTECYIIPRIRTFIENEYTPATHNKEDVIIGINEFVSADVINRVLCQLQDNLMGIYNMIKLSKDKAEELCTIDPVVIEEDITNLMSLSQCYPEFYNLYGNCQYATNIMGLTNPCVGQEVKYEANILATSACKEEITQITWYINDVVKSIIPYEDNAEFYYTFGENDANVSQTIRMELSANSVYSTSLIVTPRLCMSSTLTGPVTACSGSNVTYIVNVNSSYVPITGYSWTATGESPRNITTTAMTDQYTFTPMTTGIKTITVIPHLYNFVNDPLSKSKTLDVYDCSPKGINANTYMYFIVDDSSGFNASQILGAIDTLYSTLSSTYGNRSNYDDKVKIYYINNERTLNWLGVESALLCDGRACNPRNTGNPKLPRPAQNSGNYIVFAFQNEALNNNGPAQYHDLNGNIITSNNFPVNSNSRAYFTEDMNRLKTQLSSYRDGYFQGAIFAYNWSGSNMFSKFVNTITVDDNSHQYLGWYYDNKKLFVKTNLNDSRKSSQIVQDVKDALDYFGFNY